jgi:putative RNA 2'-phosphotransferase
MSRDSKRASKFLSLVLRHKPEVIGIQLDDQGWVDVDQLLAAMASHGRALSPTQLEHVVAENNKQRFVLQNGRIRANQGHSIAVDLGLVVIVPPERLFHGTARRFLATILDQGLRKQNRQHVHLSADIETAHQVGIRHGRPVILTVDAAKMQAEGCQFYFSKNGVWLTEHVPPAYLSMYSPGDSAKETSV